MYHVQERRGEATELFQENVRLRAMNDTNVVQGDICNRKNPKVRFVRIPLFKYPSLKK